jgi:integrase
MKVSPILKGRIDSNGQQPVQIRIAEGDKRSYRPTKIKVEPKNQFKAGKIINHPKAREYNQTIQTLIIQYQAQALEGLHKKKTPVPLLSYIEKSIGQLEGVRREGTIGQYATQLIKLKSFTPEVMMSAVDHGFLYAYQSYLKGIGNDGNTIWSSFKFLRTFINKAVNEGLMDKSPFHKFPFPPYVDKLKPYLMPDEVKAVEKFIKNKACPEPFAFAGAWFLIACRTGLRLSDLRKFDKKANIHGGRLVIQTDKTSEPVGLPIDKGLRDLFERVGYKPLNMTGEAYNRLLKVIMMGCNIKKNVSSHTARHTAAMTMANSGIGRDVVAKILAHKDLRSTGTYYKVSNQRIDMEMKKLKK